MKLQLFEVLPANGDYVRCKAIVENDGKQYTKTVNLGGVAQKVSGISARRTQVMRAMLELERDVAFDLFGAEWRLHLPEPVEAPRLAQEAIAMRPELFGG